MWEDYFRNRSYRLAEGVDLARIAREHELTGGAIINILRYACLKAVVRDPQEVRAEDLFAGIRRELYKEGKFVSGG
ncbi:hypothetical protein CCP3SC1_890003 [Gammaproteobacteria bacterium]